MKANGKENIVLYLVPVGASILAVYLRYLLTPWLGHDAPLLLLVMAPLISSLYGFLPCMFATAICLVAGSYYFIEPINSIYVENSSDKIRLVLFATVGMVLSLAGEVRRRTFWQARDRQYHLQQEVKYREKAEEGEREQRERLTVTLSSIGDAVITTNIEGHVETMNPVAETLTGWSSVEATGRPLHEVFRIINEETRQTVDNPVDKVLAEGKITGLANHTVLISRDGTERPIDDSAAPIQDASRGLSGAVLIFRDISSRKRAEEERHFIANLAMSLEGLSTPHEAIETATRMLADHLGVDGCEYCRVEETSIERYTTGLTISVAGSGEAGIAPFYFAGKAFVIQDVKDDPRTEPDMLSKYVGNDIQAIIFVPVYKAGKLAGGMAAYQSTSRHWHPGEVDFVHAVADRCCEKLDKIYANLRLQESEALKTAMINTSLDAIITMDHEGKIIEFNPAAERIFGYRRSDALGKEMAQLIIPPALRDRHRLGLSRYLESGKAEVLNLRLELRGMRSDGTEFPVELTITRIENTHLPVFTGYIRDITDRLESEIALRRSEEMFKDLADNISQLAWMADEKGYRFWYNKRWFEYTGTTFDDIKGLGWWTLHHPDHLERVVKRLHYSFETGEPWEDIFPLRSKDGDYRWFLSRASPIRNAEGGIQRWFGTNTDITDQRAMQEELRQVAARLSEVDQRKDEFLATLAHELRNPLAPIQTGLDILLKSKNDPDLVEKILVTLERQTQQLKTLVDDLLDVSRITRGKLELRRREVDLDEVVQVILETSMPLIEAAGQILTIEAPSQPVYLNVDPHRLSQAISNLLNNASKYTSEGDYIWFSIKPHGREVTISVRDSGIGIPADKLEAIFEMFRQIERPSEKEYSGLGIGLTLAKSLVEAHGGRIEVFSEGLNCGSEFKVILPMLEQRPNERRPVEPDTKETIAKRVLVVDDNVDAADTMDMMLQMNGHQVRTAKNGREGLTIAAEFHPDVVLMDLGMPEMDGYEAARKIRKLPWGRGMMLVALTGWGSEEEQQKTKEAGFNYHLVKPVKNSDLQRLFSRLDEVTDGN